jgi:branched-chain amino acid transport system ATP-binding protein
MSDWRGPLLTANNLSSGYGKSTVLHDIDISVGEGEIVALVGANGAGKSTLVKTLAGILPIRGGDISLEGKSIRDLSARDRVTRGLSLVPEGRQVFGGLSIESNLRLGAYAAPRMTDADLEGLIQNSCRSFPNLLTRRQEAAANLSGGQQQMLAIARGLMSRPKVLLLDEPSLGLAPILVSELFRLIGALRTEGISILLSEQNAKQSLAIADRAYVIENGRIVVQDKACNLLKHDEIAKKYLGVGRHIGTVNAVSSISAKLCAILER